MKKYYFLIIVALILGLALAGCTFLSNIGQVPDTGQSGVAYLTKGLPFVPVGLWHFDEGKGDKAYDSSVNVNNGDLTKMDTTTCWVPGKFGKALSFDGVDDYVEVASDSSIMPATLTIEAWIQPGKTGARQSIVSKWDGGGDASYSLELTSGNKFLFYLHNGTTTQSITGTTGVIIGTWYHVAGTYDGFIARLYVNGNLEAGPTTLVAPMTSSSVPLRIGASGKSSPYPICCAFKGLVDEVRIWDIALTGFQLEPVPVAMDIKPGSCPNPLNVKSQGVLPVAILGTEDFDVTQVDPATVKLEDVAPLRWAIEDVATPSEECNTLGPDGYLDLTLKFDTKEMLGKLNLSTSDLVDESEIVLSDLEDGDCPTLTLTGYLYDGTPIRGEDTVLIIKKGK